LPARLRLAPALAQDIAFYETKEEAAAAGFRRASAAARTRGSIADRHIAAVERACTLIRASDALPTLVELAEAAHISRFHFHRVFKQVTGTTPRDWGRRTGSAASPSGSMPARRSRRRPMRPASAPARGSMRRRLPRSA